MIFKMAGFKYELDEEQKKGKISIEKTSDNLRNVREIIHNLDLFIKD